MNWLDAVFIIILVLSAVIGLWKGLLTFACAFVAFILGWIISGNLSVPLSNAFGGGGVAEMVCFILLFIVFALLIFFLLMRFVRPLIKWTPIAAVDRIGGLGLGVAIGFGFCGFLAYLLGIFVGWTAPSIFSSAQQAVDNALHGSALIPAVTDYFNWIVAMLPEKFRELRNWLNF